MFVTVRYGDDQSRLFNINCRNEVLLYQIKKRCKMDRDEIIDLSDEHGTVKNLRQNLNEYGYDYLKERESLILLRVDLSNADHLEEDPSLLEKAVFIPMLTTLNENQDFIDALNPRDHMGSKHSLLDEDTKNRKSKNKDKKKDKKHNKPPPPKK
ncbi:protein cxorf65 [Mactra antiquata]